MLCGCDQPSEQSSSQSRIVTVALAGNPNSGKTTIFNALTGLRQKVANYPGVTVEKKTGRCKLPDGRWIDVIDLPGTYSLISRSPDEHVAMEVAERRGIHVSPAKLQAHLGVPVVPVVGHKRMGIEDLKSQIANAKVAPM